MEHREPEKRLERIEVSIAMQECVPFTQTERRNQAVDGLSHRVTAVPKSAIVAGRLSRQRNAARLEHLELCQLLLNLIGGQLVADTLQHLAEDEIDQSKSLALEFGVQPVGLGILRALEVVDPHRAVDDNHPLPGQSLETRDVEIPIPGDLAA